MHSKSSKRSIFIVFFLALLMMFYLFLPHIGAASGVSVSVASDYESKVSSTYKTNCVKFARYMVPSLPYGLTTYASKQKIANSKTAVAGAIAIVKTSNVYGHVSYVEKVNGNTITTIDGNWTTGGKVHIVRRSGTASALGIYGYYVPANLKQPEVTSETTPTTVTQATTNKTTSSISLATSRNYSTKNGIAVFAKISKAKNAKVSKAGLYLWKKGNAKPSKPTTSETFSKGFTSQTAVTIYYRPGIAFGQKLASNTTYYYQIYAVINGKTFTTSTVSIRTK